MPILNQALEILPLAVRERVTFILEVWGRSPDGARLVENLRWERFLDLDSMIYLLESLASTDQEEEESIAASFLAACRKTQRRGGLIAIKPPPTRVGRAIEKHLYIEALSSGLGWTLDFSAFFVGLLLQGPPPASAKGLSMSTHQVWVTWSDSPLSDDPFVFSRGTADFVRACLGLNPNKRRPGEPLLLLDYSAPAEIYKPTVADADLDPNFSPPPPHIAEYGLTKCWLDSGVKPDPIPRPEGIHPPVNFSSIKQPLRQLD